jgi:hypothetical protein
LKTNTQKKSGDILIELIEKVKPDLGKINNDQSEHKPSPGKWSQKEILGHLIDSAIVNHQRFVRSLLSKELFFQGYEQEHWVSVQNYNEVNWDELVNLWYSLNINIARLMNSASEEILFREHYKHNLNDIAWKAVPADQPATLDYFMKDYNEHLEHHLNQLFNL